MLILECSQGCYGRMDGRRTDGSVTISLRNFVGEGIKKQTVHGQPILLDRCMTVLF